MCCERIDKWAKELNTPKDILFASVLYHEFGHAYMHNPNKTRIVYKLIEESFCNAVSFSRFSETEGIESVMKAIDEQLFEYCGYIYFIDNHFSFFSYLFPFHYRHQIKFSEEWYYLWRKEYLKDTGAFNDIFRALKTIWKNDKLIPSFDKDKFIKMQNFNSSLTV